MPICNSTSQSSTTVGGNLSAELDNHASEAAKVKRTKEQAYFNSYDFDAIEELPFDEDEEDEDDDCHHHQSHTQCKNQKHSHRKTGNPLMGTFNSNTSALSGVNSAINIISKSNYSQQQSHNPNNRSMPLTMTFRSNSTRNSLNSSDLTTKQTYLKRLGAFFAAKSGDGSGTGNAGNVSVKRSFNGDMLSSLEKHGNGSSRGSMGFTIRPSAGTNIQRELVIGVSENVIGSGVPSTTSSDNGNFLLPRAMLKYQSVGFSNSMPLATSLSKHSGSSKSLHSSSGNGGKLNNQVQQQYSDDRCRSSISSRNSSLANAATLKVGTTICGSNSTSTNTSTICNNNPLISKIRANNKTPIENSGFISSSLPLSSSSSLPLQLPLPQQTSMVKTATTTMTTAMATSAVAAIAIVNTNLVSSSVGRSDSLQEAATTTPSHYKKKSASSSSSSIVSTLSAEDVNGDAAIKRIGISSSGGNDTPAACTGTTSSATTTTITRDRASSQSHYSTDKSGSSGYYSSNVCSTYSVEDHIYCEPVIDILDLNSASSKSIVVRGSTPSQTKLSKSLQNNLGQSETLRSSTANRKIMITSSSDHDADEDDDEDEEDEDLRHHHPRHLRRHQHKPQMQQLHHQQPQQHMAENLRILETSIENLDRHLKNYPSISSHDRIASFVQANTSVTNTIPMGYFMTGHHHHGDPGLIMEKSRYSHLPTIMEGYDSGGAATVSNQKMPWQDDIADDSLQDIDLDSFLLVNERKTNSRKDGNKSVSGSIGQGRDSGGIDNISFNKREILQEEAMENNYKCAKYINSCPEDAYHVESDIDGTSRESHKSSPNDHYLKKYEDQIHFQNTRELLEDVREKIRLLSQQNVIGGRRVNSDMQPDDDDDDIPKELDQMIQTLRSELESYLDRMNHHSEMEIRQLCTGLVKNHNIVKIKKAFERRKSNASCSDLDYDLTYEAVRDGRIISAATTASVPIDDRSQIPSIQCASDPNFKMKRKSLIEVFPVANCYAESVEELSSGLENLPSEENASAAGCSLPHPTQMQRNLSFNNPILNNKFNASAASGGTVGGAAASGDKESILDWHRKKPSIWEMYYGTNRLNQSLLGKRNSIGNTNQAVLSYPSSRPESDFTLDLPRAEQLRIKMEKEKKFRQRCRYITSFLSLIFFLLTVMVVSLVLTRGKRMFGSML